MRPPFVLALLLCLPVFSLDAAETYQPTTDFKADWITVDHLPPGQSDREGTVISNLWLCFRKGFTVAAVPEKAPARIACDSKYWLYVNGKLVVFEGQLKRGPTPRDTYFDIVDLAPHLKPGRNQVAVLMWFFGKDGFSHKNSGVPGFLFDLQTEGFELLTDATWKTHLYTKLPDNDEAWKENRYTPYERVTADPLPNYRLPESNIRYDARFEFKSDWTAAEFFDGDWLTPKVVGKPPVTPWHDLYERPIPQWKDYGVSDYVNQAEIPAVSDGTPVVCKLPYNAQVTPILEIDAPEGYVVDIRTDNYLGGGEYNVRSEYVTKKGVQRYESLGWMSGHNVVYTMPPGVKILSLQYRETGYDTEFAGSFECDDPFFNELWKKSARTLYITMRDTYFDCPDRERAQWWGDAVNELGEAFYALDPKSALLARKGMYELMWWQKPDGVIFSPIPAGNWDRELPMQMLASIGPYGFGLWWKTTGDTEPRRVMYPRMKKYMDLFEFGDDGLIKHRTGAWDWGDWGDNIDLRVLTNCWYHMALLTTKWAAFDALDKSDEKLLQDYSFNRDEFMQKRKKIQENFDKVFWNGKEYRDPAYKGKTDDRANAMAVIAGLAKEENYPAIRDVLLREKYASPYMEKYVLEALFKMGYEDDAFARMKERFTKMVEHEHTTLWEGWGIGSEGYGGGTINHAWSGGGLTMLSQYAAGVDLLANKDRPDDGNDMYVTIDPQIGPLKWIKSKTPTPCGDILVDIKREGKLFSLTVTIPEKMAGTILISKKYGTKLKTFPKEAGLAEHDHFFNLTVPAGTWTFETIEKE